MVSTKRFKIFICINRSVGHDVDASTYSRNTKGDFQHDYLSIRKNAQQNRIKISHEFISYPEPISQKFKGQYVLTARTSELKKFIEKYGNDENAFLVKEEKLLPDGTYHWNAGDGKITGKMTFGNSNIQNHIILKKVND